MSGGTVALARELSKSTLKARKKTAPSTIGVWCGGCMSHVTGITHGRSVVPHAWSRNVWCSTSRSFLRTGRSSVSSVSPGPGGAQARGRARLEISRP